MDNTEFMDEYARYKYVVDNIKDVIWEVDTNAVFTFISPTIKGMAGYDAKEMIGRCMLDFFTEDSCQFMLSELNKPANEKATANSNSSYLYDVEFVCKDGHTIWCQVSVKPIFKDNNLICYIGTSRDISEKKMYENKLQEMLENQKQINEKLEDMVTFDILTGAYNRRKFDHFIDQEMEKAEKYGSPFSISMFDIDNFKQINDVNGHDKGDLVLQDITTLIKLTLRATDKLFRWGGDEFIVLFPDIDLKGAYKVTQRIRNTIQTYKFNIEGKSATISLGVGAFALHETSDQLITRVDKALLRAKANGKNTVEQC